MPHPLACRALLPFALALALGGCARDVILGPAASTFAADAGTAMETVSLRYDEVIRDLNEQNVRFLADNPSCGLNATLRLRTAEADALLRTLAPAASSPEPGRRGPRAAEPDACLSEAEWAALDEALTASSDEERQRIIPLRQLLILSRADFELQLEAVEQVTAYVAVLADAADEPDTTAAAEIEQLSERILALGAGAGQFQQQMRPEDETAPLASLFAGDGPVASFAGHLADLGGAIEVIADGARDARSLREAILGPGGQQVPALLAQLAQDTDGWGCVRFNARRGEAAAESERLATQLHRMSRDDRVEVAREYLRKQSELPEGHCGSLAPTTRVSAVGQMFDALIEAHEKLERIAAGDLTPAERRRQAAATMQRLGAVFKAISSTAMVVL